MPARPHRTVDRVIQILETVSLSPRGITLGELATALDAAMTSVQELTNGLLARGYLIEQRVLGSAPSFSSSASGNSGLA
jgi:DNA-binding IclR family transcriptional regulator